jgi:uridine kinase
MSHGGESAATVLARLPGPEELGAVGPYLVCIEGLGGAGKSTLADQVQRHYPGPIQVISGDDFYGPEERDWRNWSPRQGYQRYFDHQRLERQLLRPLRAGAVARFQRYDWPSNTLANWVHIRPAGLIVVEGVYLLRRRLRRYWDFSVYVDTPRDIRLARLNARGENDPRWISRWAAAEDYYERVERPSAHADLVIHGF